MFDNKDNVWESAESDFPSLKREKRTLNFGIFDKYPHLNILSPLPPPAAFVRQTRRKKRSSS